VGGGKAVLKCDGGYDISCVSVKLNRIEMTRETAFWRLFSRVFM